MRSKFRFRKAKPRTIAAARSFWFLIAVYTIYLLIFRPQCYSSNRWSIWNAPICSKQKPGLSLTIFAHLAPFDLNSPETDEQRIALLSWMCLQPTPKIVLLGNDPSFVKMSAEFPETVSLETDIDFNFAGSPQFHSMVARAQTVDTDMAMIISGGTILLNDFMEAARHLSSHFENWMMTASGWIVKDSFPFHFNPSVKSHDSPKTVDFDSEIREFVRSNGTLHFSHEMNFWAWSNPSHPLLDLPIPPFAFCHTAMKHWFLHEVITSDMREVVDVTMAVTSFKVEKHSSDSSFAATHESHEMRGLMASSEVEASSTSESVPWDVANNIALASSIGTTYKSDMGTVLHAPWKLMRCIKPGSFGVCLTKRVRPGKCGCEYSPFVGSSSMDMRARDGVWICGESTSKKAAEIQVPAKPSLTSAVGLPHTLHSLVNSVKFKHGNQAMVMLLVATYKKRDQVMNWICHHQSLFYPSKMLVAATDEDIYRFLFHQGVAVFYELGRYERINDHCCPRTPECVAYHSILQILKLGISVLVNDIQFFWLKNPSSLVFSSGDGLVSVSLGTRDRSNATFSNSPLFAKASERSLDTLSKSNVFMTCGSNISKESESKRICDFCPCHYLIVKSDLATTSPLGGGHRLHKYDSHSRMCKYRWQHQVT